MSVSVIPNADLYEDAVAAVGGGVGGIAALGSVLVLDENEAAVGAAFGAAFYAIVISEDFRSDMVGITSEIAHRKAGPGDASDLMAYAGGYAIRAIIVRLWATLRFLFFDGIQSLPNNWRDNNFVIDVMTPAELVPGIGKHSEYFTLKGRIEDHTRRDDIMIEGNLEKSSFSARFTSILLLYNFFIEETRVTV